jgi:hypothetical protein
VNTFSEGYVSGRAAILKVMNWMSSLEMKLRSVGDEEGGSSEGCGRCIVNVD